MSPMLSPASGLHGQVHGSQRCPPLAISDDFYRPDTPKELHLTRSSACYQELQRIGEEAYGQVYLAHDRSTGVKVALKKLPLFRMSKTEPDKRIREGVTITTLREISHLFKVDHENVVKLIEVVYGAQTRAGLLRYALRIAQQLDCLAGIVTRQSTALRVRTGMNSCSMESVCTRKTCTLAWTRLLPESQALAQLHVTVSL